MVWSTRALVASMLLVAACGGGSTASSRPASSSAAWLETAQAPPAHATVTTHTPSPPDRRARDRERCDDGDLAGCHAAALDAYYREPGTESDADALHYFTRGCDGGYPASCNGLGVLHAQGRGVPEDPAEAARLYRAACEDGASTACQHLAMALREGRGVERDPEAAERAEARHACAFEASLGRVPLEDCCAVRPAAVPFSLSRPFPTRWSPVPAGSGKSRRAIGVRIKERRRGIPEVFRGGVTQSRAARAGGILLRIAGTGD